MPERFKILLVDDSETDRFLWQEIISGFGYEVAAVNGGRAALEFVKTEKPDLILLDLKMPEISGLDVSRYLRTQPRYQNIPIIMLTSSDDLGDKLKGFENGVDDYVTKEMDLLEIEKRIQAVLQRYRQSMDSNPLTHLPGNNTIQSEIARRLQAFKPLAVAYCDLDHFKAFNDAYGFLEGDRVIRLTAKILQETVDALGNPEDFVGHIGGDDFIFLTTPDRVELLCRTILDRFGREVNQMFTAEDVQRGYFEAKNRQGKWEKFPLVAMSIAVVSNQKRPLQSLAEVSRIASELKKLAKSKPGNVFVVDQRVGQ